jgi:hypothetical protein
MVTGTKQGEQLWNPPLEGRDPKSYNVRIFLPNKYSKIKPTNINPILKKLNPNLDSRIFEPRADESTKEGMVFFYNMDKTSFGTIRQARWTLQFILRDIDCSYVTPSSDPLHPLHLEEANSQSS